VCYQIWPHVYVDALLYMPKQRTERSAPAILSTCGHWECGVACPSEQQRCLNFARLGYVVLEPVQNHYEDLNIGVSHQTLTTWDNMRALDLLQSLPEVDPNRIGACGGSGGGLQSEMLVGLDSRLKAATVCGMCCDFRRILFPDDAHCRCNHYPGVMAFTDAPEISTLGLPAAVQYLTMCDWTSAFRQDNFPTIRKLYAANGAPGRLNCRFYDTPHNYDKSKREATYEWMERWLRGRMPTVAAKEPDDLKPFPPKTIQSLPMKVPGREDASNTNDAWVSGSRDFSQLSRIYSRQWHFQPSKITGQAAWRDYCRRMKAILKDLLGEARALPTDAFGATGGRQFRMHTPENLGDLTLFPMDFPSEGPVLVPALLLFPKDVWTHKLPVTILLSTAGKEALAAQSGPDSPAALARGGTMVVLVDVRGYGKLFFTTHDSSAPNAAQLQRFAWERNGIVWGRPLPAMGCTDLRGVLDGLAALHWPNIDMTRVSVVCRGSGDLAVTALFAAALDPRIGSADLDFAQACFEKRDLPLVPNVLRYGDVLQWAALAADRRLTLRNLPPEAGDVNWLAAAFAAAGNPGGLHTESR
jgi:cephalosporin-C deacetylase-like acetyl esterase